MRWACAALVLLLGCADLRPDADPSIARVAIEPSELVLVEGTEMELELQVFDSDGNQIDLPEWYQPQWSSNDPEAVSVFNGVVTAYQGTTRISVQVGLQKALARVRVNPIIEIEARAVYVNQVAQRHPRGNVTLIAGRPGLLRIYVVVDEEGHFYEHAPEIRVRTGSVDVRLTQAEVGLLSEMPEPDDRRRVYELILPGDEIVPGMEIRIDYDPDDDIPGLGGSEVYMPKVVNFERLVQMIVPTVHSQHPNERILEWAGGLHNDHGDLRLHQVVLPIADRRIVVHERYESNRDLFRANGWRAWLSEMEALMYAENNFHMYYYGAAILPYRAGIIGMGYIGAPVSVGMNEEVTLAHEVGHNMSLFHAPCGNPTSVDPDFPNTNGNIGSWGWNPTRNQLVKPDWKDLMGYCSPVWVSPHHFDRAISHRRFYGAPAGPVQPVLMIWGNVSGDDLVVNPIFAMETAASVPDVDGLWEARGYGADGEVLFAMPFSPRPMSHTEAHGFNVRVPYDPDWEVASVTVAGPGIETTISDGTLPPMSFVWSETGQVIAILSDGPMRGIVSDGIPREVSR